MIQWILFTLMFTLNFIFLFMKHPLTMGLLLMMQTTLICLMTGLIYKTFWFSYILFLMFIGGMLVLFIYVTSLASNEMFTLSMNLMMISSIIMLLIFMLMIIFLNKNMLQYNNLEMLSIITTNSFFMENSLYVNKLYNYPTNLLTILLMNYLLITLIAVVKVTKLFKGPLRTM
uniref:NADH dehydrogenase subunit 6 n=1 Tax=Vibrissina turrita TaxID=569024 RepID=UPI002E7834CF|nr:NADH dehydrogenase subunit 6 [Vibrissina turrita]WPJ85703.1 NADH dehydrogenase subunit 6 [Vibrissina turrita]